MKIFYRYLFVLVLPLFCFNRALAQDFKLNGAVFEKGTNLRIALAEISNYRNKYGVGSNDMGIFQIVARVGDTLLITKRGFNNLEVVVKSNKDLIISLNNDNTLKEVEIIVQSKKKQLDELRQDYKDKGSFYGGKPPLLSYFFAPLTAFYELFGRTPKNARRFGKMYETELQQSQIDVLYNKATINKNTGLTGKELEDFMVAYRPAYEKAKNWTEYDATKWISDSFKKWKELSEK